MVANLLPSELADLQNGAFELVVSVRFPRYVSWMVLLGSWQEVACGIWRGAVIMRSVVLAGQEDLMGYVAVGVLCEYGPPSQPWGSEVMVQRSKRIDVGVRRKNLR